MSDHERLWAQSVGMSGMFSAMELLRVMDQRRTGDHLVHPATYHLIQDVCGEPPSTGWTRRHLDVALDVVVREIRDGMPGLLVEN